MEISNEKQERRVRRNVATLNKENSQEKKKDQQELQDAYFESLTIPMAPLHTNRYHQPWLLNSQNRSVFNINRCLSNTNFVPSEDESILIIICPQDSGRKTKEKKRKS